MDFLSDESLMGKIQAGQLDACGLIYQRYKKPLFVFFFNNVYDQMRSEDLVQITFERFLKYAQKYNGSGSVKSWLFAIARNVLMDNLRKDKNRKNRPLDDKLNQFADTALNAEDRLIDSEKFNRLSRALEQLDPEKRSLLSMIKLNEMKYKDVAAVMDVKVSTLKVKIFRIMNELRSIADQQMI